MHFSPSAFAIVSLTAASSAVPKRIHWTGRCAETVAPFRRNVLATSAWPVRIQRRDKDRFSIAPLLETARLSSRKFGRAEAHRIGRLVGADCLGDSQVSNRLVFNRTRLLAFGNDLIQQPAAMMPAVADPARDAARARLPARREVNSERGPQHRKTIAVVSRL